jgi:aryl-alcohol dehydrogenase-like predicted oxidoreductase
LIPGRASLVDRAGVSAPLQVSCLSFGAWVSFGYQFGLEEAKQLIAAAHDAGVNL